MLYKNAIATGKMFLFASVVYLTSCSKEENTAPPPPPATDPCTGKTIVITALAASSTPCGNTGSIDASATGSTGFTFKLNSSGTYQASGTFANLAAGNYTVYAKDAGGCETTKAVSVPASNTAGPLFAAVKNLIASKCQSCHNNAVQNGSMNWENQCNIIQFQNRIKVRAVDEGTMPQGGPQLTTAQKAVITDWINAGGRFSD